MNRKHKNMSILVGHISRRKHGIARHSSPQTFYAFQLLGQLELEKRGNDLAEKQIGKWILCLPKASMAFGLVWSSMVHMVHKF